MREISVQEYVPVSQSNIWRANHLFFADGGRGIWRSVPHHVTNSPCHAKKMAQLISAYWRDLIEAGLADRSAPFYVLEIGSGIGKFGALLVQELVALCRERELSSVKFTLVMTDMSLAAMDYFQWHPVLRKLVQVSCLDFALYDFLNPDEILLINSKVTLKNSVNPVVCIANYVFCSLPQDYFKVESHQLKVGKIRSDIQLPENVHPNQYYTFSSVGAPVQYETVSSDFYEEDLFNLYLNDLAVKVELGYFIYPKFVLTGLQRMIHHVSDKILMIVNDKGFATDIGLRAASEHGFTMHGKGFSFPVDFKAIGKFVELTGGDSLYQPIEQDLATAVYCLGYGLSQLPNFEKTAIAVLGTASSGDYGVLFHEVAENTVKLSWGAMMAMLKISEWDPEVFGMIAGHLMEQLPYIAATEINKLLRALPCIERNYFPYPNSSAFHYQAGIIYRKLGDVNSAISFFEKSLAMVDEKDYVLVELARCYLEAKMMPEAIKMAKRALMVVPDNLEMFGLLHKAGINMNDTISR